jgi:hypothetical protein
MQFDAGALRYGGQTFEPINLHIRFAVAGHRDFLEKVGPALHRMPLEEALSPDAVGRSDDRARASLEVPHHPFAEAAGRSASTSLAGLS